jgi:uncharacterized cupredoxin-like copper-binding protein
LQRAQRLLAACVVLVSAAWAPSVFARDPGEEHDHHAGGVESKFSFGEPGVLSKVGRVVAIVMRETSFEPNALDVKAGETIRFVVTNKSAIDHDFTLGDAATQSAHRKEMAEAVESGGAHHHHEANAITVKASETRQLIWTFTKPGRVEFDCNVPGHFEAGMGGVILVKESK